MVNKGQSIIEYVLLIGIATMALFYMGTDFKRGIQSIVKVTVDQLGEQRKSEQDVGYQATGTLLQSNTIMNQVQNKTVEALGNNTTNIAVESSIRAVTNSLTNMAFEAVTTY